MKKLLVLAALILFAGTLSYAYDVYISSTTSVELGTQVLCGGGVKTKRGELFSVIVSSAGGATATGNRFTVWNSSFTFTDARADVDTRSLGQYQYNVAFPNGMAITKTGTATTTILYSCY